jgi:hypothetical protein
MPTIITRGLGYDEPTIVLRLIGDEIVADLVVEEPLFAYLDVGEDEPVAVLQAPLPLDAILEFRDELIGVVVSEDALIGYLSEEGLPMSSSELRLNMFLRDDRTLSLTLKYPDKQPVNLTNSKCVFTVKEKTSDLDSAAVFQKKTASAGGSVDEFNIIDAAGGKAEIYIIPDDTEDANPGIYLWDVQVTLASGKTYTVLRGRISFKEDVTRTRP